MSAGREGAYGLKDLNRGLVAAIGGPILLLVIVSILQTVIRMIQNLHYGP